MKHIMIFSTILLSMLGASIGHAISLPKVEDEEFDHRKYDVYKLDDGSGKPFSFASPKSDKPTLREIIYYHVIEKPYSGNTGDSPQMGLDTDDTVKPFTNSHSGNQFLLNDSQRYGSETRNATQNMDQAVDPNDVDEGDEIKEFDDDIDVRGDADEIVTKKPEVPKKTGTRKLLFDIAKEKYSRKNFESENQTMLVRSKRDAKLSIPEGPRLPDIDWDTLPSYIQNILSSLNKPRNAPKSSPPNKETSQNKAARVPRKLSDSTENAVKTLPKTYGMDMNSNNGIVWNNFLTNANFKVGDEIRNENKKPKPTATMQEAVVPRTARTITSDFAPKQELTRSPRTYGMNFTNGEGYTWNELIGQPRPQEDLDNEPDNDNQNVSEDSQKSKETGIEELTGKPNEKVESTEKPDEKVESTEKPNKKEESTEKPDEKVQSTEKPDKKVEPTEQPSEKTACHENKEENNADAQKINTEKSTENDKLKDWLASLAKVYMEQMLENMKPLIEKAVKEQLGNASEGTQTDNQEDKKEDKKNDKDPKLESDLYENEEPIKDNKPASNSTDLPNDTDAATINNEENLNKNVTADLENNTDWVIEDRDESNGTDLPKDNIPTTNNSTKISSNNEDFKLRDFRDNYFEFVENKSKNNSSNDTENKAPLPIAIGANTLIGNSVGNDKVTNIFIFYPNEEVSELIEELKASRGKDDKSVDIAKFSEKDSEDTAKNIEASETPGNKDESVVSTSAATNEDDNKSMTLQDNPTSETVPASASTTETVSTTQFTTEKVKDINEIDRAASMLTENTPMTSPTTEKNEYNKDANAASIITTENHTMPSTTESLLEKFEDRNEVDSATSSSATEKNEDENSATTLATENTTTQSTTEEVKVTSTTEKVEAKSTTEKDETISTESSKTTKSPKTEKVEDKSDADKNELGDDEKRDSEKAKK